MTYYIPVLTGAVLPEQVSPQRQGKIIGEYNGMVTCPMKQSDIAIERCSMNQKELACGEGCPAKAKRTEIRAVRKAKRERIEWRRQPKERRRV